MCCESDGCEIPTRRAARVNEPSSTTATKHSSWRKFIGRTYRTNCHACLLDLCTQTGETRAVRGDRDQSRQHLRARSRGVDAVLRRPFSGWSGSRRRSSTTPVQWLRVGRPAAASLPRRSGDAPSRHHLGLTVDDFDAAYEAVRSLHVLGHLGVGARRAAVRPGAAVLPRPGRQPDRAELAGRRHARPFALSRAAAARRRRSPQSAGRRSKPCSTSTGRRWTRARGAAAPPFPAVRARRSRACSGSSAGVLLVDRRSCRRSGCSSSRRRPASGRRRSARPSTTRRTS